MSILTNLHRKSISEATLSLKKGTKARTKPEPVLREAPPTPDNTIRNSQAAIPKESEYGFVSIDPVGSPELSRRSGNTVYDIDLHKLSTANLEGTVFKGINSAKKLGFSYARIITGYGLHTGRRAKLGVAYKELWRANGILELLQDKKKITQWVLQDGNMGATIVKI